MSGLDGYENVKSRKLRFYLQFPDGRIVATLINDDLHERALFCAKVYKNREDHLDDLPRGIGYALEIRDKERPLNKYGKEYDSVNFTSWTENAEESAVGRALDNAGFASNMRCSQEEIDKAARMGTASAHKANDNQQVGSPPTQPRLAHQAPAPKSYAHPSENNATLRKGYPSAAQVNRLLMIAKKNNWGLEELNEYLGREYEITDAEKIATRQDYESICDYVGKNEPSDNGAPPPTDSDYGRLPF